VGRGRISRNHIKAIAAHHERAELVAICDTQAERLEQAKQLTSEASAEHPGQAVKVVPTGFSEVSVRGDDPHHQPASGFTAAEVPC